MSRGIERLAVVAAARIFLAAHDRVITSNPVTHDDTFAMKNAADNLRDVLREYDLAALLEHVETPAPPAGVLDEAALREALAEILAAYDATPADVSVDTWVRFHAAMLAGRAALGQSGSGGGRG